MRRHPNALYAMSFAGMLAACATPRPSEEMTDEERKTPTPPPAPEPVPTNLPGETNRQFAARLKAARKASDQSLEGGK